MVKCGLFKNKEKGEMIGATVDTKMGDEGGRR